MLPIETNIDNPYILECLSFAEDKPTHRYQCSVHYLNIGKRDRPIATHCFIPQEINTTLPALALIPGGAFSSAQTFYALAPNLMAREPHRTFIFIDTPGTGQSGRDIRGLTHVDYGRIFLYGLQSVVGDAPCFLGGHSQGGGYAQTVARLNNSLNLKGLVLLDCIPLEGALYMILEAI